MFKQQLSFKTRNSMLESVRKSLGKYWWFPVAAVYVVWRIWLALWSVVIHQVSKPAMRLEYFAPLEFPTNLPDWLLAWANFDGAVFLRIAIGGYSTAELPFFPLLPLLMRSFADITGHHAALGGLLLSLYIFPLGLWSAAQLWKMDVGQRKIPFLWFVAVLLSFPTAHYYAAVYQDALFFSLATTTLLAARRKQWVFAVIFGSLASLARLNGLALFFFLLAEYWMALSPEIKEKWSFATLLRTFPRTLNPKHWLGAHRYVWFFLAIPGMLVGYLTWIHWAFGDWHLFFKGVEVWHRSKFTLPPQTAWRYIKMLVLTFSMSLTYFVVVAEAAFSALYGWILVQQWGKIRWSYWVWIVAYLTIPVVTGTLQGMPRYGLHLYPLFFVLALWTGKWPNWAKIVYVVIGLALQLWFMLWFLRGYFLA